MVYTSAQFAKKFFNKSRMILLVFTAVYGFSLLINLDYNSIRWDELVHCYGGWQLYHLHILDYLTWNTFYPPMFNLVTAGYFGVGGVSLFNARLVAVTFSLLTLWVLFEFTNRMFGAKTALLSTLFYGVMPGVIWASRLAYIETMLEFFFILSLLFFFNWLQTKKDKSLFISGLALGLGFLVKYQMIVAGFIMIAAIFLSGRKYIKSRLTQFSHLILVVATIAIAWFIITYIFAPGNLDRWIYAISAGDQQRSLYSTRFPTPIFYLIEMTWPYPDVHPISLIPYLLGFIGIGYLAWRRKTEDKFLLLWFAVVYLTFTLIGNRQWRYVMPLFPILAISAATAVNLAYTKTKRIWQTPTAKPRNKNLSKLAAGLLTFFIAVAVISSLAEANHWISLNQVNVPIKEATNYIASRINPNESVMVVATFEFFSGGMVNFYLDANNKQNRAKEYPALPVDTFTPNFKIDELITLCQENNSKYVLISEYHWRIPYFNTTLTPDNVAAMIYNSGKFTNQTTIGTEPNRIFILTFNENPKP